QGLDDVDDAAEGAAGTSAAAAEHAAKHTAAAAAFPFGEFLDRSGKVNIRNGDRRQADNHFHALKQHTLGFQFNRVEAADHAFETQRFFERVGPLHGW